MVILVSGAVGGGKTMYGAEEALDCWKRGGWVISNIDFYPEILAERGYAERFVDLKQLDPSQWVASVVGGEEGRENLVIIDEGALLFNVRKQSKNADINEVFFEFIAWSRRYGVHLFFITHDINNLDVQIRRSCSHRIHCVGLDKVPVIGDLLAVVLGRFMRRFMPAKGNSTLSTTYARFRPEVATIYDTHGFTGKKVIVNRSVGAAPPRNFMASGRRKLVLVVGCLCWALVALYQSLFKLDSMNPVPAAPSHPVVAVKSAGQVVRPALAPSNGSAPRNLAILSKVRTSSGDWFWCEGGVRVEIGAEVDKRRVTGLSRTGRTAEQWRVQFGDGGEELTIGYLTIEEKRERWKQQKQSVQSLDYSRLAGQ